ncbi:hypothetical protein KI688_008578 [Linnemannia hyalina]|uniref:P-loop containing nucleoside triphosphate hydrolase protein n=1 Tax=Linnemannia hyalina TaxID=64524 RepID=A0A9P8BWL6_9FUNG|nr:hypothetical protein KI688_008578 [Linnemannia hyalina]
MAYNENNMNCVERVQEYMAFPQEAPSIVELTIDGADILKIGVHDLRSNLTIMSQDPVLFIGTVWANLDPFEEHDDAALWAALKRVHLVSDITTPDPSSNSATSINANSAWALLKNSKINIMDEATASVDHATDAKIQATIRESCYDATLLTISHRLRTIIDFNRVIVMDHGRIVKLDTPERLIREEGGVFRTMCQRSGEFELLLLLLANTAAAAKRPRA